MDEQAMKQFAQQLRKPEGEMGKKVGEQMNSGNEIMNRATLKTVNAQAQDRLLEIGMGNGFFVKDILSIDSSIQYVGCDYSSLMVEEASMLNASWVKDKQAQFIHTPANRIPFQDNYFNKAFTVNTIYFWKDPAVELNEIHRVVKNGGSFILTVRSEESMKNIPVTQYNFTLYPKDRLEQLLHHNGFELEELIIQPEPEREIFNGQKISMESWIFKTRVIK